MDSGVRKGDNDHIIILYFIISITASEKVYDTIPHDNFKKKFDRREDNNGCLITDCPILRVAASHGWVYQ